MSESTGDWREFLSKYGYYAVSFSLDAALTQTLVELRSWMEHDSPRYTGWNPFWWPTREGIAPKVIDQTTYECIHDGTGRVGHIERWRASTTGVFTIVRAYDSDRELESGKYLELVLPVWRVGELLLYSGRMAQRFGSETVDFTLRYEGLAGRVIQSRASPNRFLTGHYTTGADRYEKRVKLAAADIETGVSDMTNELLRGLYDLFQFTLPATLCEQEISRLRSNRF